MSDLAIMGKYVEFCWSDLLRAADFYRAILTRLPSEHPTIVSLPSFKYCFEEIRFRVNDGKSQPWYRLYASAVLELETKKVIKRVDAAEAAIHGRLRDLQYDSDHHEERQLMEDAQRTLAFLLSVLSDLASSSLAHRRVRLLHFLLNFRQALLQRPLNNLGLEWVVALQYKCSSNSAQSCRKVQCRLGVAIQGVSQ